MPNEANPDASRQRPEEPGYLYSVDGVSLRSRDPEIDGREILSASDHLPPDEHVLIQLNAHGTTSVGLDEKVDLREAGNEAFRAFASDRTYRFTLDGRGYEWGAAVINEAELRSLANVPASKVFEIAREGEPDLIVQDERDIDLAGGGTEHLVTKPRRKVKIEVNKKKVTVSRGWQTGASIKAAAIDQGVEIQPDFTLDLERVGQDPLIIGDADRIFIEGGEIFTAVDDHDDS